MSSVFVLQIILIILKLLNAVDWGWEIILMPLIMSSIELFISVILFFTGFMDKKSRKVIEKIVIDGEHYEDL
jgi:hypothetical protein